jgi:hypothetical protein
VVVLRIIHFVVHVYDNIVDAWLLPLGSKYMDAKQFLNIVEQVS